MDIIEKYQIGPDVFGDALSARVRSEEMGLQGYIHVYDVDGQAYFMPGEDHDAYLSATAEEHGEVYEDDIPMDRFEQAVRIILETVMKKEEAPIEVIKVDEEQRMIYGWASVSKVDGELLVDRQGDIIEPHTLEKAVNEFMEHVRIGKTMHQNEITGQVIHSMPITQELCKAMGLESRIEGWLVGYKVYDDNTWEGIKSGKYKAFSIGGRATKEEYDG